MKPGMYIHFGIGWSPMVVQPGPSITVLRPRASYASAKIDAKRFAGQHGVPYKGDCTCISCWGVPRKLWEELKRTK